MSGLDDSTPHERLVDEDEAENGKGDAKVGAAAFQVEHFSTGKSRYFVVELVGTFMYVLLNTLFRWTYFYSHNVAFSVMNPGADPSAQLHCTAQGGNASTCTGRIMSPIAGAVLPADTLIEIGLMNGLSFALCSMSAPGATFIPLLALMFCITGLKRWYTFLPSMFGQMCGFFASHMVTYFLLVDAINMQTTVFGWNDEQVDKLVYSLLGLDIPDKDVSNTYAWCYTFMSGVGLVLLLAPVIHRSLSLHPLARNLCKGMAIAVFNGAFGLSGLGGFPNAIQYLSVTLFLASADMVSSEPHKVSVPWGAHDHYALLVPPVAPVAGVVFGGLIYRIYLAAIHLGSVKCVPVTRRRTGSATPS